MLKKANLIACLLLAGLATAQQLAPYHYAEDFSSGQAAGWTSYPPVQDVAYDPSLRPMSGALLRVVRPTRSGPLEIGFIRRMSFIASPALRLSLDVPLEPFNPPASLEVGLALRRGALLRGRAKPGLVRLSAADFGLKASEEVEAVYVVARIASASAAIEYSLRLRSVALDAERPPRMKLAEPALIESRGWEKRVAARILRQGDELSVRPPVKGGRLRGPDGRARPAAGSFTAEDHPGLWQAELPDGSEFSFLLAGKRPGPHPRMADLAELRRRVALPDFAKAWKNVQDRATRSRGEGAVPSWAGENILRLYPDSLLPALMSYFSVLDRTASMVLTNSLVAAVEDNEEARLAARKALLNAAGWPAWTPPWFLAHGMHTYYETGLFARSLALGYDLLYPHLDAAERLTVRRALRELAILPTFREHFLDARMPFATSNWIGNSLSGALVSLAVTDGEDSDQDLAAVLTGLVARLRAHVDETILPDGSSGEPLGYEDFDLEGVGWAMAALERAYGIDFRRGTALDRAHLYALYDVIGKSQRPDMGDGGLSSSRGFAWLAAHSEDARLRQLYRSLPHEPVGELLLGPPSGGGTEQPLPPSRFFEQKGAAILRSGWDPEATVLAYRAGPNFNHNHMDAGTFFLASGGELWLSEAGGTHYYNDPHYNSHFIQAVGHNVMLVDGNPESQLMPDFLWVRALDRRPRWETALASEAVDVLRTDLRPVYKAALESYRRAVVFVRPGYVVLCDRVAAREEHAFSWLFHPPAAENCRLRLARDSFSIERAAASLWVRLLGTVATEIRERDWPVPLGTLEDLTRQRIPVRKYLEASGPRASAQALLAVLYPLSSGQPAPPVQELRTPSALGLQIGAGDWVAFKLGSQNLRAADVETDADSVFLRSSGESIERLAVDSATRVTWRGRELFASPAPVTLAAIWSATGVRGTARSPQAATFSLAAFGGSSPSLRVSVPAGETNFSEAYR